MNPHELPDHDIMFASPACQGHSNARGTEKPRHDASRATAWVVVDVAEAKRPRFLAVENVPEFQKWALFPLWRSALETLGYSLNLQVLNASEFGVPQERLRLFVTGVRSGPPLPIHSPKLAPVPASGVIRWNDGKWKPIGNRLAPSTMVRLNAGRRDFGDRFLVPYFGANRTGRSITRPIGTLTTVDRYLVVRGDDCRMLSVDEAKEFMSFPASYRLTGTQREQTKQLGNAVAPAVSREIARQFLEAA